MPGYTASPSGRVPAATVSETSPASRSFSDLGLPAKLLTALKTLGYERPTPIQAASIPALLKGRDLLGNAPTGTGKTAAFCLPALANLDDKLRAVQVLVLTPTRELAIQVSEAANRYAQDLIGFSVLPIYGGQEYSHQLRRLRRGVQLVVGTPGRIMDHLRRGSLKLDKLSMLVLDEADEMLRMGFIDDVEWILEQIPDSRQVALFSATMPEEIQRIANRHLKDPASISIEGRSKTASTIEQRYWMVSGIHKLDALTRVLEVEPFESVIVFVRTKIATNELADRLSARGFSAAAINGDMQQSHREQVIGQLKRGNLEILVATDVAARGLDVDHITHVINYDVPYDTEAYIHRIGRTGRAGRRGQAILFVAPREKRLLRTIERATGQTIERLTLPSTEMVNNRRLADFQQKITDTLAAGELDFLRGLMERYQREHNVPALDIAAAMARLSLGDQPLLLDPAKDPVNRPQREDRAPHEGNRGGRKPTGGRSRDQGRQDDGGPPEKGMDRYRLEVGHRHQVKPGNIVGAIANEAGLDSRHIGRITIREDHSLIDLPSGMPKDIFRHLKKTRVCGQPLRISRARLDAPPGSGKKARKPAKK
ncbi:MAG: DEAD/DEAH box helicase [Pseudomonadota bacterium]